LCDHTTCFYAYEANSLCEENNHDDGNYEQGTCEETCEVTYEAIFLETCEVSLSDYIEGYPNTCLEWGNRAWTCELIPL